MIYCVEDDASIRELVVYTLNNSELFAQGFDSGERLGNALRAGALPQLILLDIMLPGEDGISILKRLRADPRTADIPIIMLTAKSAEYDKVIGLDSGADDYITKPFGMMELISRVKAVLRRTQDAPRLYSCGGIVMDPAAHRVSADGNSVELTLKEFELLQLLLQNAGRVLTRDLLLERIWGYDFDGETRTVDVHIRTLRQKLGRCGDAVQTVRGVGYRLEADEQ